MPRRRVTSTKRQREQAKRDRQQRKAEPFTVTPLHCGTATFSGTTANSLAYRPTRQYANGLTLGTALHSPGAAASPNTRSHPSGTASALLSLVNVLALPAPPRADAATGCAAADTSATSAPAEVMRHAVVCLINQQRAQRHLPPLHESPRLDRSDQRWSEAMVRRGHFFHGVHFAARFSAS